MLTHYLTFLTLLTQPVEPMQVSLSKLQNSSQFLVKYYDQYSSQIDVEVGYDLDLTKTYVVVYKDDYLYEHVLNGYGFIINFQKTKTYDTLDEALEGKE